MRKRKKEREKQLPWCSIMPWAPSSSSPALQDPGHVCTHLVCSQADWAKNQTAVSTWIPAPKSSMLLTATEAECVSLFLKWLSVSFSSQEAWVFKEQKLSAVYVWGVSFSLPCPSWEDVILWARQDVLSDLLQYRSWSLSSLLSFPFLYLDIVLGGGSQTG